MRQVSIAFPNLPRRNDLEFLDRYNYGEFWTPRQRQANRLHEISYRACFKPQLPAYFINKYTRRGDIVYDPFMGRGTTLIEAFLSDRIPYGNDINPLSQALTEPRIMPPTLSEVRRRLQKIPLDSFITFERKELLAFFHPKTLAQIEGLRKWYLGRSLDKVDQWIRMVLINRLTGHSKGFLSVYTMPPNQAVSVESQLEINRKRNQTPEEKDVVDIIMRKSKSLLSSYIIKERDLAYKLLNNTSDKTPEIATSSVNLVVTSPPFLDVVNYKKDNWLRCWFLGINSNNVPISQIKKEREWEIFVYKVIKELVRIVKIGGHIAFEVGEVRNKKINLENNVLSFISKFPLKVVSIMINKQKFTKTSNTWGINNNDKGTNSNRILLMKRI